jgi:hypothetical protein
MTDAPCPAVTDLFAEPPVPAAAAHAVRCARCHALLAAIDERLPAKPETFSRPVEHTQPASVGSLVLIGAPESDRLLPAIVIAFGEEGLTVVPVSPEVALATEWDLQLPASILGYPAIAQIWNHGQVLPEQIVEELASLPADQLTPVQALMRAANSSSQPPKDLPVGSPVIDEQDPRLLFQETEAEDAHPFWEPTLTLAGAATLGQLIRHRRQEIALEPEQIERASGVAGWLGNLESDTLALPGELSAGALAAAMRSLRVGASSRLARILRWTIQASGPTTGAALARGARDTRHDPDSDIDVDGYIAEFMRELGQDPE